MATISTRTRSIADLPGPRGLPLVGSAFQFRPRTMHLTLEEWARKYGPIYRLRIGTRDTVVVSDTTLAMQALRDRPESFSRLRSFEPVMRDLGMHFLFSAEGEMWKRQRRIWMASLNAQQLKPFHEGLAAITRRLLRRWQRAADVGESLDVLQEMMRYTVDVTLLFAMGVDANTLEQGADVIQRHLNQIFPALGRRVMAPFPYWKFIKLPADRAVERALLAVRAEVQRLIDAAQARLEADPARRAAPTCLIESLLVARAAGGEPFSDDDVHANIIGAMLAGEDTTANTLTWMIHYLGLHAGVFAGARTEADALLGPYQDAAEATVAQADQFPPYLPYVDGTMNEVMRLRPIAPFLFLTAVRDVRMGELSVESGTDVILMLRAAAGVSVDDPFVPPSGETPVNAGPGRAPTQPFGYGPRMCPGRNLAIAEMRSVALMVARHFELESAPGPGPVRERALFTNGPVNVRVRVRRRRTG